MARKSASGFTLMELLAAVTLMVILGSMLFTVFQNSSIVVRNASGRQQVFQQAKLLMDHMEQELSGAYQSKAGPNSATRMRPFLVQVNGHVLCMTTACKVRDTRSDSVSFGSEANVGRIGYFMGDGRTLADGSVADANTLYRFEYYSLYGSSDDINEVNKATPFLTNVVSFTAEVFDNGRFNIENWDSSPGVNKTFPRAVRITVRLTDDSHLKAYLDPSNDRNADGVVDVYEAEDPIGQTFQHVAFLGTQGS